METSKKFLLLNYIISYNNVGIINNLYVELLETTFKNYLYNDGVVLDCPKGSNKKQIMFFNVNRLLLIKNLIIETIIRYDVEININKLIEILRFNTLEQFKQKGFISIPKILEYIKE